MIFYLAIVAVTAYWVYQDSQKRSMSMFWAIAVFLAAFASMRAFLIPLGFILLVYFVYRKPLISDKETEDIIRICFKCQKNILEGDQYCSYCGTDTHKHK